MSMFKPLVVNAGEVQQLQGTADLDIPLDDRVSVLEHKLELLIITLLSHNIDLPDELTESL